MNRPRIAVVGASGAVGEVMLSILAERGHRDDRVVALASERSAGQEVEFGASQLTVENLADFDFSEVDYALFSAGGSVSKEHAPRAAEAGSIVIDNTSAFRYDDDILLVVPEVNGRRLEEVTRGSIIANPNCSTIQMVVALAPVHAAAGITRVNVATYQSVSGAGRKGLHELANQTAQRLNFQDPDVKAFAQPIAFNVLPQIDEMLDNGYSREEMKMHWETQKILEDSGVDVNATAVRVPVFYGHAEAVHFETRDDIGIEEVAELLRNAPGIELMEGADGIHPTPVSHASGKDPVYVGRLRRDLSHPRGISMWVVADNVRKGAALNAVQIMERLEAIREAVGKSAAADVHSVPAAG
ncbi:aspartate-semialdehyde dehydrogenase [Elongatibacter sediminis]|uniref:Aspartate-semialdehyde dehydrogenase n=1 Tax=Elongatibacter sediminis TaxID=3119006 RepID=A0AAW9RBW7_9GAMM